MNKRKFNLRFKMIDELKGLAVILMIFFHFSFDLHYFNFIKVDIIHHPFWFALPRFIVFLFLLTSGMSLKIVHFESISWKHFGKRLLKIFGWAALISLTTYFLFYDHWIYFGTLHAIGLISILSLPFLNWPKLSFALALMLFIPSVFFDITIPFFTLPHQSWDYIAPFPWLGASLLGIFLVNYQFHTLKTPDSFILRSLNYLGQHSLLIYLVHQPILFTTIYLYRHII